MSDYSSVHWEIGSKGSFFNLKLKEVWQYRDLLTLLVRRDFVSTYKQTVLGPLWFLIQPLFTTIIFTFVFGKLAGISTDGLPAPLFYIGGITIWNYFSECIIKTSSVFRDNADIFGKVYFPRLIMPISTVISNFIRFGLQFLLFLAIMLYYLFQEGSVIEPNRYMVLLPLLVILIATLGLGSGMIISALTTKYRDLSFLLIFGIQLLMYSTPVIIPLSAAPAKYRWIIQLNPITHILETFRYGFLGKGSFSWNSLLYTIVFCLVTLLIGITVFSKVEKNFIDTV